MDKKNKKYMDDYSLRTLAYYQREGGIYNELITILQRIRSEKGNSRLKAPNKILNWASEALNDCMWLVDDAGLIFNDTGESLYQLQNTLCGDAGFFFMHVNDSMDDIDSECVLCVLCVLMNQVKGLDELVSDFSEKRDKKIFDYFVPLIKKERILFDDKDNEIQNLRNLLLLKDDIIRKKDNELADLSSLNSLQREMIDEYKGMLQVYMNKAIELTIGLDGALSLDSISEWVRKRKHYKLTDQVVAMLKDLGRKTATDEEQKKIESLEEELLLNYSETSIVNNNMGIGSNFLTGLAQNPMMPFGVTPEQLTLRFLEFINNGARRENKD